jgi:hypothetical protein
MASEFAQVVAQLVLSCSRRLQRIAWPECSDLRELHDAHRNAGAVEKVTAE